MPYETCFSFFHNNKDGADGYTMLHDKIEAANLYEAMQIALIQMKLRLSNGENPIGCHVKPWKESK